MKFLTEHKRGVSYLLAILMLAAVSVRVHLTHDRGFYATSYHLGENSSEPANFHCNCPICHAEDFTATEAEYFDYNPIVTTLLCEFAIKPTASANRIVVTSSLRGPPSLS